MTFDRELLLRLQRAALGGDYHALLVARDLQLEHGLPLLTPSEEVGIAEWLALDRKARRLPHGKRQMYRRITARQPGPPLDKAERKYLHELLHANPAPIGPGRRCYAHPYRAGEDGVVGAYLHESVCRCWTYRNTGMLSMPELRGKAGETLTTDARTDGLLPQKIIVMEDGREPSGGTSVCNVLIGNVNQLTASGRVDSRHFGPNNLGSGIHMTPAAPGMPVAVTVYFHRACTFQCSLFGPMPPATNALKFAGVTPNPNVLGAGIKWPAPQTQTIAQELRAEGRI